MSKTLPMIISEAEALTNALLDSGGEITPELDALMSVHGKELRDKLDSYGYVIDALKSRQEYAISRLKEWERIASQCDVGLDNIKTRIQSALLTMDLNEIHGFEYSFRLQSNPPSVVIESEELIPEEFKSTEVKTTVKISKKEILDAMKDGRSVPGAYVTRSCRLVTKPSQLKEIPKAKPIAEKL